MYEFCGGLPTGFEGNPKWRPLGFVDLRVDGLHLAFLLLGEEDGVDVGEDSSLGDGDVSEELVQLFVVADGELDVTRSHPGALVVLGGVAGELEQLGGEVLEHGGHVDRGSRSETLGVASLAEILGHPADRELESGPGRPGLVGAYSWVYKSTDGFCAAATDVMFCG